MNGLKPIVLLPARERVASELRKAILSKQIATGKVLTLESVAEQLGVSATPVREAFQILSRDGLIKLFKALDTPEEKRSKYDTKTAAFPYVNGGLFHDESIEIPNLTKEFVEVIEECERFRWNEISPTIFGAVFESTLSGEIRHSGGRTAG